MKRGVALFSILAVGALVSSAMAASNSNPQTQPTSQVVGQNPGAGLILQLATIGTVSYVKPNYPAPTPDNPYADKYESGPISMLVTIKNPGSTPISQLKVSQDRPALYGGGTTHVEKLVDVPALGVATVTLTDPYGLANGCADQHYTLGLAGTGNVDTRPRAVILHPTCTFTPRVDDPWNQSKPDTVDDIQQKYVYVSSFAMEGGATCGGTLKANGAVTNHSKAGASVTNKLFSDPTHQHVVSTAGPSSVPIGQSTAFTMTIPNWSGETLALVSEAPANPKMYNRGMAINPQRHCTFALALVK